MILIKGKNNPFFGKHHTDEVKKRLSEANKGSNNSNWQEGISKLPYAFEFDSELKESIRKRDNYECQNCGMTEEEHIIIVGKVLCIHHIDYNKENSKKENLITVCLWCNTRANSNRNHWQRFYTTKIIQKDN